MDCISLSNDVFSYFFSFFGWRDALEISFFSTLFYYFSLWLSTDTQKNLLSTFYGYWFIAFASYFLQLTSMTIFLFAFCPVTCALFIIVHQEFLQRNFITLRNIIPSSNQRSSDWLELLMRICLQTINKNKEICIIIEQNDSLHDRISIPFCIDAELDQTLLTLLIDGTSYDQTKFIWFNKQGRLLGINATWQKNIQSEWVDKNILNMEQWKQDALAITHKTDAIIIGIGPLTRTFSVIAQGKLIEQLQGTAALRIIKKILATSSSLSQGALYDYSEKNSNKQAHT